MELNWLFASVLLSETTQALLGFSDQEMKEAKVRWWLSHRWNLTNRCSLCFCGGEAIKKDWKVGARYKLCFSEVSADLRHLIPKIKMYHLCTQVDKGHTECWIYFGPVQICVFHVHLPLPSHLQYIQVHDVEYTVFTNNTVGTGPNTVNR